MLPNFLTWNRPFPTTRLKMARIPLSVNVKSHRTSEDPTSRGAMAQPPCPGELVRYRPMLAQYREV